MRSILILISIFLGTSFLAGCAVEESNPIPPAAINPLPEPNIPTPPPEPIVFQPWLMDNPFSSKGKTESGSYVVSGSVSNFQQKRIISNNYVVQGGVK